MRSLHERTFDAGTAEHDRHLRRKLQPSTAAPGSQARIGDLVALDGHDRRRRLGGSRGRPRLERGEQRCRAVGVAGADLGVDALAGRCRSTSPTSHPSSAPRRTTPDRRRSGWRARSTRTSSPACPWRRCREPERRARSNAVVTGGRDLLERVEGRPGRWPSRRSSARIVTPARPAIVAAYGDDRRRAAVTLYVCGQLRRELIGSIVARQRVGDCQGVAVDDGSQTERGSRRRRRKPRAPVELLVEQRRGQRTMQSESVEVLVGCEVVATRRSSCSPDRRRPASRSSPADRSSRDRTHR